MTFSYGKEHNDELSVKSIFSKGKPLKEYLRCGKQNYVCKVSSKEMREIESKIGMVLLKNKKKMGSSQKSGEEKRVS